MLGTRKNETLDVSTSKKLPEVYPYLVFHFFLYLSVSLNEALLSEFLVPKTRNVTCGQDRQLGYSVLFNNVSVFLLKIALPKLK